MAACVSTRSFVTNGMMIAAIQLRMANTRHSTE
jgi:hypothetical protein